MDNPPVSWIVVADEGRARFLECREAGGTPVQVELLTDAAARADGADLRRDAMGRRGTTVTASAGPDPLEKEAELFARRVAETLGQAHRRRRFDALYIAAAPKFLGRLRQQLEPQVAQTVRREFDKDWLALPERELAERMLERG